MGSSEPSASSDLAAKVAELAWYHTFDLPGGVTTVGMFDHRRFVNRLPFPEQMSGLRCLDAAAADGFFGFEMARRGAEVVSLDLPDPTQQDMHAAGENKDWLGQGRANRCFGIVRDALGLDVERVDGSLYDIPELGLGEFDFVFLGNILLHLQDPIRALKAIRTVTSRGQLMSVEPISMPQTLFRPFTATAQFSWGDENTFWTPSLQGHRAMVTAGGFEIERTGRPFLQPMGRLGPRRPGRAYLPKTPREVLYWSFTRQFGKATSWILARRTA